MKLSSRFAIMLHVIEKVVLYGRVMEGPEDGSEASGRTKALFIHQQPTRSR